MSNNSFRTGLVLLALALVPALAGCKYNQENLVQAENDYAAMLKEGGVPAYAATGDPTIDAIVKPVVDQAHQYQLEYTKWQKSSKSADVVRTFKGNTAEEVTKYYSAMKPEERTKIEEAVAAAKKEQDGQMKTLLQQAEDIAKGAASAAVKVQAAAKGDGGGILGLGDTAATLLSGPGKAALDQAARAGKFCDIATTLIKYHKQKIALVAKVVEENSKAQQGGR